MKILMDRLWCRRQSRRLRSLSCSMKYSSGSRSYHRKDAAPVTGPGLQKHFIACVSSQDPFQLHRGVGCRCSRCTAQCAYCPSITSSSKYLSICSSVHSGCSARYFRVRSNSFGGRLNSSSRVVIVAILIQRRIARTGLRKNPVITPDADASVLPQTAPLKRSKKPYPVPLQIRSCSS